MDRGSNACPHLPPCPGHMDYRSLNRFGGRRDAEFYLVAQKYSQYLWLQHLPARSILSLCRAMYAPLHKDDPIYATLPLPYAALFWLLKNSRDRGFLGNPRISFQHQSLRIKGPHQSRQRARAHAMWWLSRIALPELPADSKCKEPSAKIGDILQGLGLHGISGEAVLFQQVVENQSSAVPSAPLSGS